MTESLTTRQTKATARRTSARARLLAYLQAQRVADTAQLIAVGGASAPRRVWELRQQGHVIDVQPIPGSPNYRYTYRGVRAVRQEALPL